MRSAADRLHWCSAGVNYLKGCLGAFGDGQHSPSHRKAGLQYSQSKIQTSSGRDEAQCHQGESRSIRTALPSSWAFWWAHFLRQSATSGQPSVWYLCPQLRFLIQGDVIICFYVWTFLLLKTFSGGSRSFRDTASFFVLKRLVALCCVPSKRH